MLAMAFRQTKRLHVMMLLVVLLVAGGSLESRPIGHSNDKEGVRTGADRSGYAGYEPLAADEYARETSAAGPESKSSAIPKKSAPTKSEPEEIFPYLDINRMESVEVVATGYYAGKESTGKSPGHPEYGVTFSGVKVRRGTFSTIAADPAVFPLGTILHIPGYGYGVVADTGSAIKGNKIDLYFNTKDQVYRQWGKKNVKVTVVKRGDGKVTEVMMDRLNNIKSFAVDNPPTAL